MTILVAGTVEIDADKRDQALHEAAALMPDTRSQAGCTHYVWAADPSTPTRIYVFESWEDTEQLAAHLTGPYYSQMLGVLGKHGVTSAEVSKYKIALEEPVYDPEGQPRADFFTE